MMSAPDDSFKTSLKKMFDDAYNLGVAAEREACALIIERSIVEYGANEPYLRPRPDGDVGGLAYAQAIRARSNPF